MPAYFFSAQLSTAQPSSQVTSNAAHHCKGRARILLLHSAQPSTAHLSSQITSTAAHHCKGRAGVFFLHKREVGKDVHAVDAAGRGGVRGLRLGADSVARRARCAGNACCREWLGEERWFWGRQPRMGPASTQRLHPAAKCRKKPGPCSPAVGPEVQHRDLAAQLAGHAQWRRVQPVGSSRELWHRGAAAALFKVCRGSRQGQKRRQWACV